MKQPADAARFIGINGYSRIAESNGAVTGAAMGTQRWVQGWAATGAAKAKAATGAVQPQAQPVPVPAISGKATTAGTCDG